MKKPGFFTHLSSGNAKKQLEQLRVEKHRNSPDYRPRYSAPGVETKTTAYVDLSTQLPKNTLKRLRPSALATTIGIIRSLLKPATVVVVMAGFFFSVSARQPTLPNFDFNKGLSIKELEQDEKNLNNSPINIKITKTDNGALDTTELNTPITPNNEHMKQVAFIAGLIAVHRPRLSQSGNIARHIVERSANQRVDPFYIAAIISVESSFAIKVRSSAGALGLMQLMPRTAKEVSRSTTGKKSYPRLSDPQTNIELGIEYIKRLERQYRGNRYLALAAYNWGPGNIAKIKRNKKRIPKSVHRYASKIIERSRQWKRHYDNADKHSASLEQNEAVS